MGLIERLGYFYGIAECGIEWQRPFFQGAGKSFAFQILHDEVVDSVLVADIIERANVWMIKAGDGFGFSLKALLANGIIRKQFGKNFNRNGAI